MLIDRAITRFDGEYGFLSNFYLAPLKLPWCNLTYPSSEHAYQASKCKHLSDRDKFIHISPGQAKRLGRVVAIRNDWDLVKVNMMKICVQQKFIQNGDLLDKLLAIDDDVWLEEGNTWGDVFWGTVDGKGLNVLGNILMEVRRDLREFFGE